MKKSIKTGISFGLVSGVLTTLGLLIGLGISTQSKIAVISGILTIAITDALSDAFGIHLSQESTGVNSEKHIWEATFSTFLSKFFISLTFVFPVLMLSINFAVLISIIWGFILIGILSLLVSKNNEDAREERKKVLIEHLVLFSLVILLSYIVGRLLNIYL